MHSLPNPRPEFINCTDIAVIRKAVVGQVTMRTHYQDLWVPGLLAVEKIKYLNEP